MTSFAYFSGIPKGLDKLWIIGDNYVASTYQQYFIRKDSYMKGQFEVSAFFNNALAQNRDVLGRIKNAITTAFNQQNSIPKIITIILESDLANSLPRGECDQTTYLIYSKIVKNLATHVERSIEAMKEKLPGKCVREGYPHVLWIQPVLHDGFKVHEEYRRKTFIQALDEVIPRFQGMSTLELKQAWEASNPRLLIDRPQVFTSEGNALLWEAIDRTVKYCDAKFFKSLDYIKCPSCYERIDVKMQQQRQRERRSEQSATATGTAHSREDYQQESSRVHHQRFNYSRRPPYFQPHRYQWRRGNNRGFYRR